MDCFLSGEQMTERQRFEQWARFQTFDNMQALTAAWIAWQARAELAETELAKMATAHRSNGQ